MRKRQTRKGGRVGEEIEEAGGEQIFREVHAPKWSSDSILGREVTECFCTKKTMSLLTLLKHQFACCIEIQRQEADRSFRRPL